MSRESNKLLVFVKKWNPIGQTSSYEPLWRKIVFTGLFFIPTIEFLLATLYCVYAITVNAQYANNCSEALPFLILLTVIYLTARSSYKYLIFQQEYPG